MQMDVTLLLGVLGTIAALVAVGQSHRANRLAAQIAKAQDVFGSPDLQIDLFQSPRCNMFFIAVPIPEGRVVEFQTTFLRVHNNGRKTARDVELFLRIPRRLIFGGKGYAELSAPDAPAKLSVSSVAQSDHVETLLIRADAVNPGIRYGFALNLSLMAATLGDTSFPVQFADGSANVKLRYLFSNRIELFVSQSDAPARTVTFSLAVINTARTSITEFFAQIHGMANVDDIVPKQLYLIEIPADSIIPDAALPIDRVSQDAKLTFCGGLIDKNGYLIPGVGVHPAQR